MITNTPASIICLFDWHLVATHITSMALVVITENGSVVCFADNIIHLAVSLIVGGAPRQLHQVNDCHATSVRPHNNKCNRHALYFVNNKLLSLHTILFIIFNIIILKLLADYLNKSLTRIIRHIKSKLANIFRHNLVLLQNLLSQWRASWR